MTRAPLGDEDDALTPSIRTRSIYVASPSDSVSGPDEGGPFPEQGSTLHEAAPAAFAPEAATLPGLGGNTAYESPANPGLPEEVTYISGINPDGTLAFYSFQSWNGDNPATYDGGYTQAAKWYGNSSASTAGTPGGTVLYYFDPASNWTTPEKTAFIDSLDLWSAVANISFQATTNSSAAQIVITRGSDGSAEAEPQGTGTSDAGVTNGTKLLQITKVTISIDTSQAGFGPIGSSFSTDGGYPWTTVLHELGHAIGLGHGGPYNEGDSIDPSAVQYSPYDSRLYSIMSYVDPNTNSTDHLGSDPNAAYVSQYPVSGTDWGDVYNANTNYIWGNSPTTLMPLDILAAQQLYGTPTSTPLSGGQTFGFNVRGFTGTAGAAIQNFFDFTKNASPVVTLWDSGTGNTLDLSGFTTNDTINLNPGSYSSAGTAINQSRQTISMVNNIAIAFNTRIDTLDAGGGNDTIVCNNDGDTIYGLDGNDVITGGSGNDTIYGGSGNDTIDGGAGTDTVVFSGNYSNYTITTTANGYTVAGPISDGTDTITNVEYFQFADGTVAAGAPFHSAPVLSGAGNTVSYTEQAAGTVIDGGLTITDASSTVLTGATITITGPFVTGDVLNFTNQNGIIGSYTGVETLTLSGSASVAAYQAALRSITFSSSSDNPDFYGNWQTRTVTWHVDDGAAVNHASNTVSSTINITAVNDAPVLSGTGNTTSYTPGSAGTVIDNALTITDPDSQSFLGATVWISAGFVSGDILNFTSQNGITANWYSASHTLTLSGNATLASYQAALRSITFSSSNPDPTNSNANPSRTVTWELNDGNVSSADASSTVNIADTIAPTLVSTSPADNSRGVSPKANLVLSFNEAVKAGSGNALIHRSSDNAVVAAIAVGDASQVSFSGATMTINPAADLLGGIGYYLTLASGVVTDLSGNAYAGISSSTAFNFSTLGGSSDFDGDGKGDVLFQNGAGQAAIWFAGTTGLANAGPQVSTGWNYKAVGDVNGDGKSDIVIQNTSGAIEVWMMNGAAIQSTADLNPGSANWQVVGTGDFDGDGKSDVLLQNGAGQAAAWFAGTTSLVNVGPQVSAGWSFKAVGDVNGDGKSDIVIQNTSGATEVWMMNGAAIQSTADLNPGSANWQVVGAGDFDGDGKKDVLFQNGAGQAAAWFAGTTSLVNVGPQVSTGWSFKATGDVNGDGKGDIVIQNTSGATEVWMMNGTTIQSTADLNPGSVNWQVVGGATQKSSHIPSDFDGDGKSDVLFQNGAGQASIWFAGASSLANVGAVVGAGWSYKAVGDINGDGKTDIVIQNTSGATEVWMMNGTAVQSYTDFNPGGANWQVVGTGDFDGDGKADVLFQNGAGQAAIWFAGTTSLTNIGALAGAGWSYKAVGDINGDGKADIVIQNTSGATEVWMMNGTALQSYTDFNPGSANWQVVGTGDFDGDGKADVLFQNGAGQAAIWFAGTTSLTNAGPQVSAGWSFSGIGDYNGDGKSDIVIQNTSGATEDWMMNGASIQSTSDLDPGSASWQAVGGATQRTSHIPSDFNGDGRSDILFQNGAGQAGIWFAGASSLVNAGPQVSSGWSFKAVGDLNSDGRSDIVIQNTSGAVEVWMMNGTALQSSADFNPGGASWQVVGTGDFDGDGKGDVLFQNGAGQAAVWFAGTSSLVNVGPQVSSGWSYKAVGDVNGDGKSDIVIQNTSGATEVWMMNGTAIQSTADLDPGSATWQVAGTGDFDGDGKADILFQNGAGQAAVWFAGTSSLVNVGPQVSSGWSFKGTDDYNGDGKADIIIQNTSGATELWMMSGTTIQSYSDLAPPNNSWIAVAR